MPVIPPNRGKASQPQKPPWVRDVSTNQQADVPWRRNNLRKTGEQTSPAETPKQPPKKPDSPVKAPPKADPEPEPTTGKKTVVKTIPIQKLDIEAAQIINMTDNKVKGKPPTAKPPPPPQNPKPNENGVGGPPPPPPPPGPPPPPMPGATPVTLANPAAVQKVAQLRKAPRKRPDWGTMMKEIETGRKLRHVECNDRSKPIIPRMKSLGKFVFDSEAKPATKTDAIHNRLLSEIQGGIKLKKVQCNDRSKPFISGLRKFMRQMTVEEQAKANNASSPVDAVPPPEEMDFIDDIDALRDDLQSAKQMLEMEIQSKVRLGKQNRDLQCQIITMEAEIEKLRAQQSGAEGGNFGKLERKDSRTICKSRSGLYKCPSGIKKSKSGVGDKAPKPKDDEELGELSELEEEISSLKLQIQLASKGAEEWENRFKESSQKFLLAQGNLEDSEQKRLVLEKKLEKLQNNKGVTLAQTDDKSTQTEEQMHIQRSFSVQAKEVTGLGQLPQPNNLIESEEESEEEIEMDEETVIKKKQEREVKLWENKLKSIKEKQNASKMERKNLKGQQKKFEADLKAAKARLKELSKEVDKMGKMLKDSEADEEESEEEESEEESEEETESESEEEESEEEESSEEDDPDESHDERLGLFNKRVKRRENILSALRKGNYLLRANIDVLKDSLEENRLKYLDLEQELNTVLADV